MTKKEYLKYKMKYDNEKSNGLLYIYNNNYLGNWDIDKRRYIRMLKKESKSHGNKKLGKCFGCGCALIINNFGGFSYYGYILCDECYDDYHHDY